MSGELMNNDDQYREIQTQPELEIMEIEQETDHSKLMKAYRRISQNIDMLIEKKRKKPPQPSK